MRPACAVALTAVGVSAPIVHAQANEHPVHWSAPRAQVSIRSGDTVRVALHATIGEFFHLYSTTQRPGGPIATSVALVPGGRISMFGSVRAPAPDTIPDGNFGIMAEVYDDSVTLGLTLRADTTLAKGRVTALVGVRYQACTARYCLPPRIDTVRIALIVMGRAEHAVSAPPGAFEPVSGGATSLKIEPQPAVVAAGGAGGAAAFLLLAASMGALALLTPCVFPMIPMTVMAFLGNSGGRRQGITRAALYALGIVGGFTGLGVLAAVLFGAAGLARLSASPAVNLGIATLFVVFALSLLGVVQLTVPRALMDRLTRASGKGAVGPLAMGALFTLTAFTCTVPFVGTLLVMAAEGSWRWPLIGMLVFSTVFAAPFFLLALLPGALQRSARPGDWMPAIERTLGALELAAAAKFVSNADLVLGWGIFTRQVVLLLWLAILLALIAALLWPTLRRTRDDARRIGRARAVMAAGAMIAAAALVPGLSGGRLGELEAFLPPPTSAHSGLPPVPLHGELPWMLNDYDGALAAARRDGRPILVDFTGYTCTNCRWMEANMFPRAEVKRALARFVRMRLYTDGLGEPYISQQALEQRVFGTVALPFYAVLDSAGRPRATFLGMTRDERAFMAFLALGPPKR